MEETLLDRPFVGPSGRLLNAMLWKAGVYRRNCLITNVFDFRLANNNIAAVCEARPSGGGHLAFPVESGKYVKAGIGEAQLSRLRAEFDRAKPKCVVALGATAVWALLGISPAGKMQKLRGTVHDCVLYPTKVVVTYHPAYVLRSWTAKAFVEADLQKAARVADGTYRPLRVQCQIPQSAAEIEEWFAESVRPGRMLSVDIETSKGQIDSIGFNVDGEHSLFVPFFDAKTGVPYWNDVDEEEGALRAIARVLEDPTVPKVGQNFAYDMWWIIECWGVRPRGWCADTRTLHHSLWPDLPKSLADMAATYLDLPAWKHAHAEAKRE